MTDRITHERARDITDSLRGGCELTGADIDDLGDYIDQQENLDSARPEPPYSERRHAAAALEFVRKHGDAFCELAFQKWSEDGGDSFTLHAEVKALQSVLTGFDSKPELPPAGPRDSVWLVQVGHALLNYVARSEEEANEHIGPDVAQGFKAVEYVPREPAQWVSDKSVDDADRILDMTDEELDAEIRATGEDPARVNKWARATGRTFTRMAELYAENRTLKAAKSEPAQAVDADEVERAAMALYEKTASSAGMPGPWPDASEQIRVVHRVRARIVLESLRSRPAVVDAEVVELIRSTDDWAVGRDLNEAVPMSVAEWLGLSSALRSLVGRKP